ncbi:MAG: hypothetical protein ACLQU5_00420 [Isosphaeraceae bacterium]
MDALKKLLQKSGSPGWILDPGKRSSVGVEIRENHLDPCRLFLVPGTHEPPRYYTCLT